MSATFSFQYCDGSTQNYDASDCPFALDPATVEEISITNNLGRSPIRVEFDAGIAEIRILSRSTTTLTASTYGAISNILVRAF